MCIRDRSKEKTVLGLKETPFAGQNEESSNTPANSAANQTVSGMKTAAQKGADLTYRGGKKLAQTASRKVREKREASRVIKEAKDAAGQTGKAVKDTVSKTRIKLSLIHISGALPAGLRQLPEGRHDIRALRSGPESHAFY